VTRESSATESRLRRRKTIGFLQPNIVSYNQSHPSGEDISSIFQYDVGQKPDMLIVMGTTLSIPDLRKCVETFAEKVHARRGVVVFINKEALNNFPKQDKVFDYIVLGDVDEWSVDAARHWRKERPGDWDDSRGGWILRCLPSTRLRKSS
jgi:NAD-dependent histone deacetylase SIR2